MQSHDIIVRGRLVKKKFSWLFGKKIGQLGFFDGNWSQKKTFASWNLYLIPKNVKTLKI